MLMTIPVLYNLTMIIARAILPGLSSSYVIWLAIDYVTDLLYIIDIFIQSRKGFHLSLAHVAERVLYNINF